MYGRVIWYVCMCMCAQLEYMSRVCPVSMLFYVIIVVIISFWFHCPITPPIPTRARVHADNNLKVEGAKALVPALQAMTGLQSLNLASTLPPPYPG